MNITATNGTQLRTMNSAEQAIWKSTWTPADSFYSNTEKHGRENMRVLGRIGRYGTKTHEFSATVITINDTKLLVSAMSLCGSQSYKSGTAIMPSGEITCAKCKR